MLQDHFARHLSVDAIEKVKRLILGDIKKKHIDSIKLIFSAAGLTVPHMAVL